MIRNCTQRYTTLPLPGYRFVPGQTPHPRKDPLGHSYQQPEPTWPAFAPEEWQQSTGYLYGVDLFNATLWWESHEQWESLWMVVGKTSPLGYFLRGLIQLSAAHLRHHMETTSGSLRLLRRAQENLERAPEHFCGLHRSTILQESLQYLTHPQSEPTLLLLKVYSESDSS